MKLTRIFMASALLLGGIKAQAQLTLGGHFYGEDAFRYSQSKISGSARMQGMGGSYTSLGADASNAYSNPAGLGFYNRSELSITPIFNSINSSSLYAGSTSKASTSNANIGQLGLIMSSGGTNGRKKRPVAHPDPRYHSLARVMHPQRPRQNNASSSLMLI